MLYLSNAPLTNILIICHFYPFVMDEQHVLNIFVLEAVELSIIQMFGEGRGQVIVWMQQSRICKLVVLQEMPFCIRISFVFLLFLGALFLSEKWNLSLDLEWILNCVFLPVHWKSIENRGGGHSTFFK